jgi:hypothetical protein
VALTHTNSAGALDTLAAAYAELGHFSEAAKLAQTAAHMAQTNNQEQLATKIQKHLQLYEQSQPVPRISYTFH